MAKLESGGVPFGLLLRNSMYSLQVDNQRLIDRVSGKRYRQNLNPLKSPQIHLWHISTTEAKMRMPPKCNAGNHKGMITISRLHLPRRTASATNFANGSETEIDQTINLLPPLHRAELVIKSEPEAKFTLHTTSTQQKLVCRMWAPTFCTAREGKKHLQTNTPTSPCYYKQICVCILYRLQKRHVRLGPDNEVQCKTPSS